MLSRRGFFGAAAAAAVAPAVAPVAAPLRWVDAADYVFRRGDFPGQELDHALDSQTYLLRGTLR